MGDKSINTSYENKNLPIVQTDTCGGIIVNQQLGPLFEIAKQHDNVEKNGVLEFDELIQFFEHIERENFPLEQYAKYFSVNDTHYVYNEYDDNGNLKSKTFVGNDESIQAKFYYHEGVPVKLIESMPEGQLETDLIERKTHILGQEHLGYAYYTDERKRLLEKVLHSEDRNFFEKLYHKIHNYFEKD